MSWIVTWEGREYDIDPGEFNGLELSEIKKRAGFSYRQLMTEAIPDLDPDAWRVLFWTIDRRANAELTFGEYAGPPIRLLTENFAGYVPLVDALGKAIDSAIPKPTSESDGSESSPSSTDALIGMSGLG